MVIAVSCLKTLKIHNTTSSADVMLHFTCSLNRVVPLMNGEKPLDTVLENPQKPRRSHRYLPWWMAVVSGAIAVSSIPTAQAASVEDLKPASTVKQIVAPLATPVHPSQPLHTASSTSIPGVSLSATSVAPSTVAADLQLHAPAPVSDLPSDFAPDPVVSQASSPEAIADEPSPAYASQGLQRWYVHGGAANTLTDDDSRFAMVGAGISQYFADGHSINLELNSMAFDQPGSNALGLNLATLLRWDFVRQENWSLYIDGGVGIIGTTNPVPGRGSSFNFTPQVGGGATIELDGDNRLMLGLRWHHISNANTYENNPGLDTILGYVGINFPR